MCAHDYSSLRKHLISKGQPSNCTYNSYAFCKKATFILHSQNFFINFGVLMQIIFTS